MRVVSRLDSSGGVPARRAKLAVKVVQALGVVGSGGKVESMVAQGLPPAPAAAPLPAAPLPAAPLAPATPLPATPLPAAPTGPPLPPAPATPFAPPLPTAVPPLPVGSGGPSLVPHAA